LQKGRTNALAELVAAPLFPLAATKKKRCGGRSVVQLSEKLLELQSVKTNKKNLLIPLEGVLLFQREKEGPTKR
jgi:hypothetical protein